MKKLSTNPIDQHFREVLKSPDLKYNKQDWKGLEKMLPKKPEKTNLTWWLPASTAAALVLLFTSLWILNKPVTDTDNRVNAKQKTNGSSFGNSGQAVQKNRAQEEPPVVKLAGKENREPGKAVEPGWKFTDAKDRLTGQSSVPRIGESFNDTAVLEEITYRFPLASLNKSKGIQSLDSLLFRQKLVLVTRTAEIRPDKTMERARASENRNGKVSLGLSISPDLNSIGKFSDGSFGNSFGLTASYQISPRLSVNTALAYSKKVYSALPYEYKAPWAMSNTAKYAKSIDADCRVLDIPLNLKYNFLESSKRTFFASAGVSSYIMLEERYTLDVNNNQGGYPGNSNPSYAYKNENQHFLSVLNLSTGLTKPLSKQTSLVIEPYARLPLTGIGQGNVKLKSVGINFQLQYNIKKRANSKPNSLNALQ